MELFSDTEVKTCFGEESFEPEDRQLWKRGMEFLENGEPTKALAAFCLMSKHTGRTMFNIAEIFRRLGSTDEALEALQYALHLDPFLAIAYYKRGNINYDRKRYLESLRDFELAQLAMHGQPYVEYSSLGMCARLYRNECIKAQEDCLYILQNHPEMNTRTDTDGKEFMFYPKMHTRTDTDGKEFMFYPKQES